MWITNLLKWIINKIGVQPLISITLLLMASGSVSYGLAGVLEGVNSSQLMWFITLALLLSWLLARTKIWGWLAAAFLLVFGIVYIFIDVGNLFNPLVALLRSAYFAGVQSFYPQPENLIDLTSLNLAYSEIYYSSADILNPVNHWVQAIFEGRQYYDDVIVMLLWGSALWASSAWAGWNTRRNNQSIISILPAGSLLIFSLSYTGGSINAIIPLLFSALLLMGLTSFIRTDQRWQLLQLDFPEDLPQELAVTTIGVTIGLVMVAFLIPSISIPKIVNFVRGYTQPQIEEAEPVFQSFGLEQPQTGGASRALWGGMPRYHTFQSSPEFLERVVMSVQISGGSLNSLESDLNLPFYWRSLTYDQYTGSGWFSTDVDTLTYDAGEEFFILGSPNHAVVQQDIHLTSGRTNYLYAAGYPLTADSDYKISWRPVDGEPVGNQQPRDLFGGTIEGASYRLQSVVPHVNEQDLITASEEYPPWVAERYLQLPEMVSDRVIDLAFELTAGDESAYEKARSLEAYLRGFEYNLALEEFPENREMVAYFIFDLQEGYCDYYATSMAVMARAVGLPARLAIGYYRGEYDYANKRYIVIEADAHSWTEIYFPEIGWIPFEPTAGRAAELPTHEELAASNLEQIENLSRPSRWALNIQWRWQMILWITLGMGFVAGIFIPVIDSWRIKRMTPFEAVKTLYNRLYSHGRSLRVSAQKGATPLEFATNLNNRLMSLSEESFWQKNIGQAVTEVQEFTHAYVLMLYSPLNVTVQDREEIYAYWRYLRRRLWIARFRQWMSRKHRGMQGNA